MAFPFVFSFLSLLYYYVVFTRGLLILVASDRHNFQKVLAWLSYQFGFESIVLLSEEGPVAWSTQAIGVQKLGGVLTRERLLGSAGAKVAVGAHVFAVVGPVGVGTGSDCHSLVHPLAHSRFSLSRLLGRFMVSIYWGIFV
jgi:hypothetical protein